MGLSVIRKAVGANAWAADIPRLEAAWWGAWTAVGLLFAMQLGLHYRVPPFLSLYWGLTDWYLWGGLGVALVAWTHWLRRRVPSAGTRGILMALVAPAVIALHVALTLLVGMLVVPLGAASVLEHFVGLFAKKLTLNAIAFGVIAVVADRFTAPVIATATRMEGPSVEVVPAGSSETLASEPIRGYRARSSRLLSPSEILCATAAGNYVDLTTADGTWMVRCALRHLERRWSSVGFVQVSRSDLVNLVHLTGTRNDGDRLFLILSNGQEVAVAKRRRADVQRRLRARFAG